MLPTHSQAALVPSARVTLGLLHALQGVGTRAFHRWLRVHHLDLAARYSLCTQVCPQRIRAVQGPCMPTRSQGHGCPSKPILGCHWPLRILHIFRRETGKHGLVAVV